MKKKTLLIMASLLLLMIGGCSEEVKENKYTEGTDYPFMFKSQQSGDYITASEDGYYFLDGFFLYYMDKEIMEPVVVCNKPNCKHEDETDATKVWECNAFFESLSNTYIQYYEGKLYTVQKREPETGKMETNLVEVSLDGMNREKLLKVSGRDVLMIHRGYLYIGTIKGDKVTVTKRDFQNLQADGEVIFELTLNAPYMELTAYGNYVYIRCTGGIDEEKSLAQRVYVYDIQKNKTEKIITGEEDVGMAVELSQVNAPFLIFGKSQPDLLLNDPELNNIYKANLDGTEVELLHSFKEEVKEFQVRAFFDGKYYCTSQINAQADDEIQKKREIVIYDTKWNRVAELSLEAIPWWYDICMGDDDYMFITYDERDGDETYKCMAYISKKDFQDGKCQLNLFSRNSFSSTHPSIEWRMNN